MGPMPFLLEYDGDAYSNTPQLAAASFSALQGLNAANSITLDFNAMDVSPNATPGANNIFFSVVNSSNSTVFNENSFNHRYERDNTGRGFGRGAKL